jgi:butyryl-CoA dehydrogenase
MNEKLSTEEFVAFQRMAASFANKSIAPMLAKESPDGDLALLPGILEQAREAGLLASARHDAPGRETGIWGAQTMVHGPEVSAMLLEELAVVCGGVAMCFHAQGIATLPLVRAENPPASPPERVAMAFSESFGLPGLATLREPHLAAPAPVETIAEEAAGGYELSGEKTFIYGASRPEAYIVFARLAKEGAWACLLVPTDSKGLEFRDAGARTGLRACELEHLKLDRVRVDEDQILRFSHPACEVVLDQLCFNLIGLSAIATGIARGAIASAREYAAERYQGGDQIIKHPAIKMLLADSDARIAACQASIARAAGARGDAELRFIEAVRAKLFIMQAAAGAVTDCLQVFGGYGYMEDYRMEKRLRDVSVLKSAGGAPRELRMILAEMIKEG